MHRFTFALVIATSLGMSAVGCSDKKNAPTPVELKADDTHKGIALVPIQIDASQQVPKKPTPCYTEDTGPGASHLKLGKTHLENREAKDAKTAIERAIALDPKNALAHFELGRVHNMLGQAEGAAEAFRLSTELAKSCEDAWIPEAYRLLGFAIRKVNGSNKAIKQAWHNYLDRTTVMDANAKEVRRLLIPLERR